jgi:hypothetical protein
MKGYFTMPFAHATDENLSGDFRTSRGGRRMKEKFPLRGRSDQMLYNREQTAMEKNPQRLASINTLKCLSSFRMPEDKI